MGVQHHYNETTTTMKSIFLIAAFAALAIASRSADDTVPEEDDIRIMPSLVQETSLEGLASCASVLITAKSQRCKCTKGAYDGKGRCTTCHTYGQSTGYGFNGECGAMPPAPPKVCECTVDTGNGMFTIKTDGGPYKAGNAKWFDWAKLHNKGFREITCKGCAAVEVHDDDHSGWKDHKYVASSHDNKCCGSNTCRFEARGFLCSHDLCDDVNKIALNGGC